MRVCLKRVPLDPELLTLFINAVVESGGDALGIHEAREMLARFHCDAGGFPRLDVARVRLEVMANKEGDYLRDQARDGLSKLASLDRGPFDAVVAFAEVLISEGKLAYARHHLHRALAAAPEHPRVLRLLALSYIHQGPFFEPEYAVQIALKACQITGWRGVHELYILAQAYLANEDKVAALMAATQAKNIAARLIGGHPDVERLERSLQTVAQENQL
jgi:predicted Zn-dependent protease